LPSCSWSTARPASPPRWPNGSTTCPVQPFLFGRVALPELDNRSVLVVGVDMARILALKEGADTAAGTWGIKVDFTPAAFDLFNPLSTRTHAIVSADVAAALKEALPDGIARFRARVAGEERQLDGVGTVTFDGPARILGKDVIFLKLGPAGAFVSPDRPDYVTQMNVRLAPGADLEQVRQRLQEVLGDEAEARTIEANDLQVRDVTAGLELGFLLLGVGALVVGVFLVYNTLAVSVAERRHDIGILRSVGATRGQIARLFLGEAGLLGLLGSLLGLPLGYALAAVALGPVRRAVSDVFVPLDEQGIDVSAATLVVAVLAGVGTTIVAALVPALQAAQEEPADAVRRVPVRTLLVYRLVHVGAVALLIGAGLACVALREQLPIRTGAFGGVLFLMVGALVAAPLVTALLGRLLQPFFRHFLGLEGRLAADNLVRAPGRTGLVIAALTATAALVLQTAGLIRSTKDAFLTWFNETIGVDLLVTSGGPASSAVLAMPMGEHLGDELRQVPGVKAVMPVALHRLDYRDRIVFLIAVDTLAFDGGTSAADEGGPELVHHLGRYPRLREGGTALVSENFAALYKVGVGDRLTFRGLKGPVQLEVLGTMVDYTWNRGTLLVDRKWYREQFAESQVEIYDVYLEPGADREAVRREVLDRWKQRDALFVETREETNRAVEGQLDRVYGLAYAQQFLVGAVALLGVVSALFISVLQRRRELGLLRAVGASREQVLKTVLAEAVLMGLFGALMGFAAGLALQWYVIRILLLDEAGFVFPVRVAWLTAAVMVGLSVLLPQLVGLWPALRATRTRIPEAIAYE
jgi:putative ABC transport system permease protein